MLALDGDRELALEGGAEVTARRDGPWLPDIAAAMRWAVAQGIIAGSHTNPTRS